jgi:NAD(P)H-hydrate epimerase
VGDLVVADIGISAESLAAASPSLFLLEDADAARAFPLRRREAHKGDFGHVLSWRGRWARRVRPLAAGGALRSGCGLVTVATPEPCLPIVAAARAEAMTEPLPATAGGGLGESALPRLLDLAAVRDAVVLGPGLGQDPETRALVRAFVRACPVPLVIDADGLNALAPAGGEAGDLGAFLRDTPTVLPPRRMARRRPRTGISRGAAGRGRLAAPPAIARWWRTVAEPRPAAIAATGNPGMATGGTGDVLAGVVGSLLARHGALLSATAAVVVHGRAGDLAARERGEEGLTAADVVDALPGAIESLRRSAGGGESAR